MLFYLISWLIAGFLQGLFFFLLLVFFLYWFYLKELPVNATPLIKPQFENYAFNSTLRDMVDDEKTNPSRASSSSTASQDLKGNCDGVIALNMIFQFLFQELKDTKTVRRYIIRKMSAEFKELLTTKAAGKIVQRITARDFSLGTSFPIIHSLKLHSYEMNQTQKSLQEMSVIVDLEYNNGFSISIDADLILGRSAYIHIKVVSIKGKARIQFTRSPFTHWNFAFIEDPQIEFDANSHFDGRQIPQLTALILNQLRRSVRRKHTLPNYKCRFKPFFDQIYNQNLFKPNIDEILLKNSASNQDLQKQHSNTSNGNETNKANSHSLGLPKSASMSSFSNEDIALTNIQQQLNELTSDSINNDKTPAVLKDDTNKYQLYNFKPLDNNDKNAFNSYQYRKLCEKLGFDLTNVGQLVVNFKSCDRLPETLYSLNLPQYQIQSQQQQQQANSSQNQPALPTSLSSYSLSNQIQQDSCIIYLTASVDQISMKSLMSKQICKEHWPLIEFEIVKNSAQNVHQSLGFTLTEFFLINRNEVIIQKIMPNSSASNFNDLIKIFDIIYSVNQIRVTSMKQFNKMIQKTPANASLKFIVQRPCILMENRVNSSANGLLIKKVQNQIVELPKSNNLTNNITNSPAIANQPTPTVSNTRQRLEFLEKKIKFSFGSTITSAQSNAASATSNESSTIIPNNPTTPIDASIPFIPSSTIVSPNTNQPQSLITASSHCLVDYFCSVSECSINEQLIDLDLVNLLTDKSLNSEETQKRKEFYIKKTKDIKLEKENLISFNNIPIQVEETYGFDLDSNTKYLNIFLWTIQYSNKMSKIKNLLIGYVTLPLHEISVDCWNTIKGETQTTVHFTPVDEFKASAASAKLSRSHVISDHPGFDSSLSVGTLTINFQHKLKKTQENKTTTIETNQPIQVDEKQLTETIVEELIEQNKIQIDVNKTERIANEAANDDGSIHKFVSMQFNESVACEFCNKKIWFKNAFQCIYCNYKIHMKCYEKAFGKTICPRFFSKNKLNNEIESNFNSNDEPFEMITSSTHLEVNAAKNVSNEDLISVNSSSSNTGTTRNLVSNFFSGIRQRRSNQNQESHSNSNNSFNILNSFNLNVTRNRATNLHPNNINTNNNNNISDELSNADLDEFKDIDSNQEKLFGTELFDELPLDERKVKFDELITKYQSTIDMMKRLKSDYEKELDVILKSKKNRVAKSFLNTTVFNQKEERLRSEIKHTDEQMKCVMFLLMQCQIGLGNCIDLQSMSEIKSTESPRNSNIDPDEFNIKETPSVTIKTDENFVQ